MTTKTITHQDLITLSTQVAAVASMAPDFDGSDPWGSAMGVWFACADHLYNRNETIPDQWEYRHGLGLDEPDELYTEFANDYLTLLGNRAEVLAKTCEDLGLSY